MYQKNVMPPQKASELEEGSFKRLIFAFELVFSDLANKYIFITVFFQVEQNMNDV